MYVSMRLKRLGSQQLRAGWVGRIIPMNLDVFVSRVGVLQIKTTTAEWFLLDKLTSLGFIID